MDISVRAECIELTGNGSAAVIVAEGLRSWRVPAAGEMLVSGPRLTVGAPDLGRLRVVPDRLGVQDGAAETHAVVLARNCRDEEMELTQRWTIDDAGGLAGDFEFIVPPAWGRLEGLGVGWEFSGTEPAFSVFPEGASVGTGAGIMKALLCGFPAGAGIYRMKLTFIAKKQGFPFEESPA